MKVSLEIDDELLARAKALAARDGMTIDALVEEGLRKVLDRDGRRQFRLRSASFCGQGLGEDQRQDDWNAVRDEIYSGRGS
jgi:hypothetical protein